MDHCHVSRKNMQGLIAIHFVLGMAMGSFFLEIFTFFFSITKICYRIKGMENVTDCILGNFRYKHKKEGKEHLMDDVR